MDKPLQLSSTVREDAADRADPQGHQHRDRKRGARAGGAATLLAGSRGPVGVPAAPVRTAYEKLSAAQLIVASRAGGNPRCGSPAAIARVEQPTRSRLVPGAYLEMTRGRDLPDGRACARNLSRDTLCQDPLTGRPRGIERPAIYPDPRGELDLRWEIASYLAVARASSVPHPRL